MINCFWKKRTDWKCDRCSTGTAVWLRLTAEEAEAGLVAADVLAVRWLWLEERRLVVACQLVKITVVSISW